MAYQLEFAEERAVRDLAAQHLSTRKSPGDELRRAYDSLMELAVGTNTATRQALEEYRELYQQAYMAHARGDTHWADRTARGVKHLCRAAWFDAKIKHLESHANDLPHLSGLTEAGARGIMEGIVEVENRLARLKLTGLADRFGHRCRKHLERIEAMSDKNTLLADTFMKAAYEYCLATEVLHELEMKLAA